MFDKLFQQLVKLATKALMEYIEDRIGELGKEEAELEHEDHVQNGVEIIDIDSERREDEVEEITGKALTPEEKAARQAKRAARKAARDSAKAEREAKKAEKRAAKREAQKIASVIEQYRRTGKIVT